MNEMPIALRIPTDRDRLGSFRSPDIAAPASIPVTAGKKMAKTVQNGADSKPPQSTICPAPSPLPRKNETSDNEISTMIKY